MWVCRDVFHVQFVKASYCGLLAIQVKISWIELGALLQAIPIIDMQRASAKDNQTVCSQVLHNAIGMHRRQAKRIAEFSLGDRELAGLVILCQANCLEPHQQLTQE